MAQSKFAVIGLGQFGTAIAKKLAQKGAEVMAIDNDEERVEAIKDDVSYAVTLDATDGKALKSQNILEMDAVVVAIGENFQDLLLTTFTLQELEVKRIMARVQGPSQRRILEKMGIKEILSPEDEVGNNVAESLINPNVLMSMQLPDDYQIVEVKAPKNIFDRTLEDIGLRQKYEVNLVTLLRKEEDGEKHIIGVPSADTVLQEGDVIVLFGKTSHLTRFLEINK
ncbi:potassium channel family protein [Owenweeksia hongkongensis]|uniref:potassium channel family protein n=1 Tax=Owenweeksia hongkongensis TaxID=253245 RepID=UPI003A8E5DAA